MKSTWTKQWTTLRRTLYRIQVPKEAQLLRILYNAIQPMSLRKRVTLRMWSGCGPPKLDTNVEPWRERARKSVKCFKRLIRENADYLDTKGKTQEKAQVSAVKTDKDLKEPPELDSDSEGDIMFGKALAPVEGAEETEIQDKTPQNICAHPDCTKHTNKKYKGKGYFQYCIDHAQSQKSAGTDSVKKAQTSESSKYKVRGADKVVLPKCSHTECNKIRAVFGNGNISLHCSKEHKEAWEEAGKP